MQIQLDQFEGPLGLLLYLIRKEEMDIYDIPIHKITHQYLEYVKQLQSVDLEQAGDFIAMAATLIQIKAKMLLPNYNDDGEILVEEDPRKPLVKRLLEYQKFQEAGKQLYERPLLGRDMWTRGIREDFDTEEGDLLIEDNALFALIKAYRGVVKKANKATHRVAVNLQSIASRILEMSNRLVPGQRVEIKEFFENEVIELRRWIITFISSLELGKLGYVNLFQDEAYGPLYLEPKKEVTGDIISQVEEYETVEDKPIDFNSNGQLTLEEQNYLQDETIELSDVEVSDKISGSLKEDLQDEGVIEEAATDDDILQAEKELNLIEEHDNIEPV
ncbi:MAG: segregation/condensation protein A [Bdellovibrionales bacterium]|nr:segregation/condensation protein A [Bdellovibrionales bacterium]